jgi:hypothetical protein
METVLNEELPRSRLAVLPKHFAQIVDGRQSYCDDEIVAWGSISFWHPMCPLLRTLVNRLDPLSEAIRELDQRDSGLAPHDLIAIDGECPTKPMKSRPFRNFSTTGRSRTTRRSAGDH